MTPQIEFLETVKKAPEAFRVPLSMKLGGISNQWKSFWKHIGNFETQLLADKIETICLKEPIYVAGLARSGSTILLEILSGIPKVVTHQYRDFPAIFIPHIWNSILNSVPSQSQTSVERTHLDGMFVTPTSPEAMEEILWMAFFDALHQPECTNVLSGNTLNPEFEKFYTDHIKKLLCVREGDRYVSKGNYNITRVEYLLRIFPDARFIIPIRKPDTHIASLMKQHSLFCEGETLNPRMLEHMRSVGHFEFGLDRRPINVGNHTTVNEILELWEEGLEAKAWARYWASMYGFIDELLSTNTEVKTACKIVRFEDLCESPESTIQSVLDHCELRTDGDYIKTLTQKVTFPRYYQANFSRTELEEIESETADVAHRFGY